MGCFQGVFRGFSGCTWCKIILKWYKKCPRYLYVSGCKFLASWLSYNMINFILKAHKLPYPVIMTSSRDCDVISRDQFFFWGILRQMPNDYLTPSPNPIPLRSFVRSKQALVNGWVNGTKYRLYIIYYVYMYYTAKNWKCWYLTLHISEPFWARNLNFFLRGRVDLKLFQRIF